jgi:hypothetical protein
VKWVTRGNDLGHLGGRTGDDVGMQLDEADDSVAKLRQVHAGETRHKNMNNRHVQSPHLLAVLRAISLSAGRW